MKKKLSLILAIILVGIVLTLCYCKSNWKEKLNQGFQLPNTIEDQILKNLSQAPNTSGDYILNNLVINGKWIELRVTDNYDK